MSWPADPGDEALAEAAGAVLAMEAEIHLTVVRVLQLRASVMEEYRLVLIAARETWVAFEAFIAALCAPIEGSDEESDAPAV